MYIGQFGFQFGPVVKGEQKIGFAAHRQHGGLDLADVFVGITALVLVQPHGFQSCRPSFRIRLGIGYLISGKLFGQIFFYKITVYRFKHRADTVQVLFVPLRAYGNDFLNIFVFRTQSVGSCPAVAESEQAVFFHAFVPQDLAHVIGGLGIGQRGCAERGASVSARIYCNHAVVLLQPSQQRGKVDNRTETAVQQHDNGSCFRTANLVVQQRTLIFDDFGLHGFSLVSGCLKCLVIPSA